MIGAMRSGLDQWSEGRVIGLTNGRQQDAVSVAHQMDMGR